MKKQSFCFLVAFFCFGFSAIAFAGPEGQKLVEEYTSKYPSFELKDTAYTFETEFILPEGFSYPSDNKLSEFSRWVSHFPIWHKTKQIGRWDGGKAMEYDKVSRVVHLPWKGQVYTDAGFMVRILFDYLLARHKEMEAAYTPVSGDVCTYPQYLKSKMMYNNRGAVVWQPADERPHSLQEYYKFMYNNQLNSNYAGLILNSDPVKPEDVQPGDMFIAHDSTGRKGVAYIALNMIVSGKGEKRFAFATGCQNACDFHIVLLNDNRNAPWVPVSTLQALAPPGSVVSGFYRFKLK